MAGFWALIRAYRSASHRNTGVPWLVGNLEIETGKAPHNTVTLRHGPLTAAHWRADEADNTARSSSTFDSTAHMSSTRSASAGPRFTACNACGIRPDAISEFGS